MTSTTSTTLETKDGEFKIKVHEVREPDPGTPCNHYYQETGRRCGAPAEYEYLIEFTADHRVAGNRAKIARCDRHGSGGPEHD